MNTIASDLNLPQNRTAATQMQPQLPQQLQSLAAESPDRLAVRHGGRALSLGALDSEARRIAGSLRSCGVGPGDRVGLYLERTQSLTSAILGVWYVGAAYVPLDPWFPRERLEFMMADAELGALLISDGLPEPEFSGATLSMTSALSCPPASELAAANSEDTAYLIYTSGSTGQPKGVVVSHGNVANFLCSMLDRPGFGSSDVLLAVTTLSFDISVLELWGALLGGGVVEIASRETASDGAQLKALLSASSATVLQATPATWRLLLDAGWEGGSGFRALVGGEAFPADLLEPLTGRCEKVWNLYGPTETTVWSSCGELKSGELIHVGEAIGNTQLYVLDESLKRVEGNQAGELYIGGAGVAQGYWRRDTLTAERFLADPFSGGRMYRTGDRVRWTTRGRLEHLGRLDDQVKIRGFRIELGEIESVLASQPGIRQAVVNVHEVGPSDQRLVGYFVGDASESELRRALRQRLPEYMVPQHFQQLAQVPLTPNGKVDRRSLPPIEHQAPRVDAGTQSLSETVRGLLDIWAEVLGYPVYGLDVSFFDVGGTSGLVPNVIRAIEDRFKVRISVAKFFENSTIQALDLFVHGKTKHSEARRKDERKRRSAKQRAAMKAMGRNRSRKS